MEAPTLLRYLYSRRCRDIIMTLMLTYIFIATLVSTGRYLWSQTHGPFRRRHHERRKLSLKELSSLAGNKGKAAAVVDGLSKPAARMPGDHGVVTGPTAETQPYRVVISLPRAVSRVDPANRTRKEDRREVKPDPAIRLAPLDRSLQGSVGCYAKGRAVRKKGLDCRQRMPDVLGIGVEKCATTALSFFMSMHPNVAHSYPKALGYWNRSHTRSTEWYRSLMPVSSNLQVTMEFTPWYIFDHEVALKIKETLPDAKFIVMVRDPVARAMSHYLQLQFIDWARTRRLRPRVVGKPAFAFLNDTFETSVMTTDGDIMKDNAIVENGLYELHLGWWFSIFPPQQFLVIDEGVFRRDPLPILQEVEEFIGLPKFFNSSTVYFDKDKGCFCRRTSGQACLGNLSKRTHPPIRSDVLKKLKTFYRPFNIELMTLLGRKLSWHV